MFQVKFRDSGSCRIKADSFFKKDGYWWRTLGAKEERLYQIWRVIAYKPPLGRWINV